MWQVKSCLFWSIFSSIYKVDIFISLTVYLFLKLRIMCQKVEHGQDEGLICLQIRCGFKISVVFQPQIYIEFNHQILNMSHAKTCVGGF